jgi:hypothetical protein
LLLVFRRANLVKSTQSISRLRASALAKKATAVAAFSSCHNLARILSGIALLELPL